MNLFSAPTNVPRQKIGLSLAAFSTCLLLCSVEAAPTPTPAPSPLPTPPETVSTTDDRLPLKTLLAEVGGPKLYLVPLGRLVETMTGVPVVPLNRKDTADAAVIKQLGDAMNKVLREMNQPKSAARSAVATQQKAAAFMQGLIRQFPPAPSPGQAANDAGTKSAPLIEEYPGVTVFHPGGERTYCIILVLSYENPDKKPELTGLAKELQEIAESRSHGMGDSTRQQWSINAVELLAAKRALGRETSCLLIAVETSGQSTFLNWELYDAEKLPVSAGVTFENLVLPSPAARLDDGRKGTD